MSDMHDPYEDQLAAARYRAERDQARQECERLQRKVECLGDDIENLKLELGEAKGRLRDRSRDTTVSAYDLLPEEDREALRWVREHGGLAEVEKRLMPEGCEWPRYENGSPVILRDYDQSPETVNCVAFVHNTSCVDHESPYVEINPMVMWTTDTAYLSMGERVKLPAVLAADGEPLEVGQTVYHIADGKEYRVSELLKDGGAMVEAQGRPTGRCRADYLTHQRPDSLDRLAEDIGAMVVAWRSNRDLFDAQEAAAGCVGENTLGAALDGLARRAKALAGVSERCPRRSEC